MIVLSTGGGNISLGLSQNRETFKWSESVVVVDLLFCSDRFSSSLKFPFHTSLGSLHPPTVRYSTVP